MCWARQFPPVSGLVRRHLSRCRVVFSAYGSLAYYGHVVLRCVACVRSGWSCTSSEHSWYCGSAGPRPTAPQAATGRLSRARRPPAALGPGSRAAPARHRLLREGSGAGQAGAVLRGGPGLCRGWRRLISRFSVAEVALGRRSASGATSSPSPSGVIVVITIIMTTLRAFTCDDLFRFNNM